MWENIPCRKHFPKTQWDFFQMQLRVQGKGCLMKYKVGISEEEREKRTLGFLQRIITS